MEKRNSLTIQNVHLAEREGLWDVIIKEGYIEKIVASDKNAHYMQDAIEGAGGFLSPGFVDMHMHLEKTMTVGDTESPGLKDAIETFQRYTQEKISPEDIERRAEKVILMALKNGTTALRTHVTVDNILKTMAVESLLKVREKFKGIVDVQIIAMISSSNLHDGTLEACHKVGTMDIEGFGAAPALSDDPGSLMDIIFDLAEKYGKIVDLHSDEHLRQNVAVTNMLMDKVIQYGMQNRCAAGHLCALSAVDEDTADKTIQRIRDAGLHVVTLPSCNLYLMGREFNGNIPRGTTRIRELLDAGVNISLASDNIRDPFRPFGNGDILEEMLITAQVAQMGTFSDLERVYRMGTYHPASALGLKDYGVKEGCKADLVLLDASGPAQAILDQSCKKFVFKAGKIVCENKQTTKCDLKKLQEEIDHDRNA